MCIIVGRVLKFVKFAMIYRHAGDKTRSTMQRRPGLVGRDKHYAWTRCNAELSWVTTRIFPRFSRSHVFDFGLVSGSKACFVFQSRSFHRTGSVSAWISPGRSSLRVLGSDSPSPGNPLRSPEAKDTLSFVSSGHRSDPQRPRIQRRWY